MPLVPMDGDDTVKKKLTELGRRVRDAREQAKLSQVEVAAYARVALNTVRGVESGTDVHVCTLFRVCAVLQVQLGDLFGGE